MKGKIFFCSVYCVLFAGINCFAQKQHILHSGLAETPLMGWSSWNTFKKNPMEEVIRQTADAMVATGLQKAGYTYINIDDFWSTGRDVKGATTQWAGVLYELDRSAAHPEVAGPGHWNDADMLLVGVGSDSGRLVVMTGEEQRSHFSMWCMIASPLILGNDLRGISAETLAIVTNKEAIAINQDVLGVQGILAYEQSPGLQVWVKKLRSKSGNKYAVALFNRSAADADITLDFDKLGLQGKIKVRDVWTHRDLGTFQGKYAKMIMSHDVQLLIIQ